MDYSGSTILVLGAGLSGIGVAHTLAKLGANVTLNDYKLIEFDASESQKFEEDHIRVITGQQDFILLEGVDRVVVSPGISLEIPIISEAKKRHIPVVGEVEIAYEVSKAPILGVTGTNGKTTTTSLLAAVFRLLPNALVVPLHESTVVLSNVAIRESLSYLIPMY